MMMRSFDNRMNRLSIRTLGLLSVILWGVFVVGAQSVDSSKLIDSFYNEQTGHTTFFVSNIMTVAEDFGREVYVVNDGRSRRLPQSIIKMVFYFNFPGRKRPVPESVTLAFDSGHYRTYQFGSNRDLVIKADGEKLDLGTMKLTDRRDVNDKNNLFGSVHMWETVELPIRAEQYRKIINAKSVSMRIGDLSAGLNEEQLKRLRKFAEQYLK